MACGLAPNDFPFFSLIDLFFDQFLGDFFDAIFWSIDLLDVFSKKNSDRFKILEKSSLLQRTSLQRWLLTQEQPGSALFLHKRLKPFSFAEYRVSSMLL